MLAAFFHAPLKIFVGLVFGMNLISLTLIILMGGVLMKLMIKGAEIFKELEISWFDIAMGGVFVSMLISLAVTAVELNDAAGTINCMGHILTIPFGYFLFRLLISNTYGDDFIGVLVGRLLKISVIWLVIEFSVINIFNLATPLEEVLNPVLGADRLFDGLGGSFVKAAGPIPGSQNGSIISAMALSIFWRDFLHSNSREKIGWVTLSAIAFLTTFTLTGVIVMVLVQMIFWPAKEGGLSRIVAFSFTFIAFLVSAFSIEAILSLKTGVDSSEMELTEYYWSVMWGDGVGEVLSIVAHNPLGVGWMQNASDPDVLSIGEAVGPELPKEIYLLRMITFGGVPLVLALSLFFVVFIKQYKNVWLVSQEKQVMAQSYFVVLACILFSTLHYPSILSPGFAILFAAVVAQLATNSDFNLRVKNDSELIDEDAT